MAFIDRSNANGADDYKQAGVRHLYLKATEGTGFVDATRANRRAQALADGIVVGDYHYADLADPTAECDWFMAHSGPEKAGQFRGCLDCERGKVVSDVAWCETWVLAFHADRGYLPVLYGPTSLIAPMRAASKILTACAWWRAEYGPNDGSLHALQGGLMGAAAHQYTSVATLPGISGHTDISRFLGSSTPMLVPAPKRKHHPLGALPPAAWRWAQWRLGLGRYKGHARDKALRPKHAPRLIPISWWRAVAWYVRNRPAS